MRTGLDFTFTLQNQSHLLVLRTDQDSRNTFFPHLFQIQFDLSDTKPLERVQSRIYQSFHRLPDITFNRAAS
jgi:hypothetical protein